MSKQEKAIKEKLMEQTEKNYIAMYDVRGIQDYIFKTNYAKEIVGASCLIDSIIINGLNEYVSKLDSNVQRQYMTDWKNDNPSEFLDNEDIAMQVMFIGGGNAYVLFRNRMICSVVNRFLGKYVLEKTYSLNLAVAVCEKTNSYANDYKKINDEMRRIKAKMPNAKPIGALPFMERDSITGFPISTIRKEHNKENYYCTEAAHKRDAFPKNESEQIFDNMVTLKGDNSSLAVCHIDGNSMGIRIRQKMEHVELYHDAIRIMRALSQEIANIFRQTFDEMTNYMEKLTPKVKEDSKHKLYREIIVAGDDITFVCNAKLARSAVENFLENIVEQGYSACAGIAYFNSHFPFSDAYKVAEACCDSAKKCAKKKEHLGVNGMVGCYMDFQICTNIRAANLKSYRDKHYLVNGQTIIARPYYVPFKTEREELNVRNEKHNITKLKEWLKKFDDEQFIARNKAKKLRNIIPEGLSGIESYLLFLKSRGIKLDNPKEQYQYWYDALEILDIDLVLKEGDTDEDKN